MNIINEVSLELLFQMRLQQLIVNIFEYKWDKKNPKRFSSFQKI